MGKSLPPLGSPPDLASTGLEVHESLSKVSRGTPLWVAVWHDKDGVHVLSPMDRDGQVALLQEMLVHLGAGDADQRTHVAESPRKRGH